MGKYAVGNKELYFGNGNNWVFYDQLKFNQTLQQTIAEGRGTIPTDNVGCFLRAAKFTAIVPGKHDFYFGAERVRQFARFLAGPDKTSNYEPVQMLGANLVLRTFPIDGVTGPKKDQPGVGEWAGPKVLNLKEGQSVYPWFTYIKIEVLELRANEKPFEALKQKYADGLLPLDTFDQVINKIDNSIPQPDAGYKLDEQTIDKKELLKLKESFDKLRNKTMYLCLSRGAPDQIPSDFAKDCKPLTDRFLRLAGNTVSLFIKLPPEHYGKNGHFTTLTFAKNYGLCTIEDSVKGCLRFSSLTPFFTFPRNVAETTTAFTDPDPYVVKDRVAIFGVVDPALSEQVGVLNVGWQNEQPNLTTRVSVEDPAEALRQQLDYFEVKNPNFKGLKILLVQTVPQRAKALAARFPQFQVVVSAADLQQGTSEVKMSNTWDPSGHRKAFLAVPSPYFNSNTRKGSVHFGTVSAVEGTSGEWELTAKVTNPVEVEEPADPATDFWTRIKTLPGCLPSKFQAKADDDPPQQAYLKWLVLCAMRDHTSADVALIQAQDLFDKIPDLSRSTEALLDRARKGQTAAGDDVNIQQMLDRLIWKGDLITLLYVPGSDLRAALKKSDEYASEADATFSLGVDGGRHLETLGVMPDGEDYLINGLPLDDTRIYAVATTDYIGAGDTGYPDLVKAALNPRTHPAAFSGNLIQISTLVCRKLFPKPADALSYCQSPLISEEYLDVSTAKQIPPYKRPGFFQKTWEAFELEWPASSSEPGTMAEAIEQTVQRREIWKFSLPNFSFGFQTLNNNFTDEEVEQKFGGIPVSGVTTGESQTFNVNLETRLSRSSHKREFYFSTGIDYERQSVGDDPDEFQISQITNRVFSETGLVLWRKPGRSLPNLGINLSLYTETQLQRPYSVFSLASGDPLRITQGRSLAVLPRLGIRWQNTVNAFELGAQYGREINALEGYRFNTEGVVVECAANSQQTFSDCIAENSDPDNGGSITKDSEVTPLLADRPRAGLYWKTNFAFELPFTSKVKYEMEQTGDFFFVNFGRDTTVDTRFRNISKHRLSFIIWPSVSIGPTLDLLMFQNKINKDFLFQRQFGIETKISFDLFNRREKDVQLKHKP